MSFLLTWIGSNGIYMLKRDALLNISEIYTDNTYISDWRWCAEKHFQCQKFEYLSPILLLSGPSVYKNLFLLHVGSNTVIKKRSLVIMLYTQVTCCFQKLHLNHPVQGTWLSCKRPMVIIMVWLLLYIQRYLCPEAALLYTPKGVERVEPIPVHVSWHVWPNCCNPA